MTITDLVQNEARLSLGTSGSLRASEVPVVQLAAQVILKTHAWGKGKGYIFLFLDSFMGII